MKFLRSLAFSLLLLLTHLLCAQSRVNSLKLTFTTIDVPGAGETTVSGINTAGDMVGWYSQAENTPSSGFLLSGANFTFLNYPGGYSTVARSINDSGLIVGYAQIQHGAAAVGFTYTAGTFNKIRVGTYADSYGEGIDSAGDIVGGYGNFGATQGFEQAGTKFKTVTPPGTFNGVYATGINKSGEIVGWTLSSDTSGFFYNHSKFQTIAVPGANSLTEAWSINDSGIVVGWYDSCNPLCADHAFAFMKGKFLSFDYPGAMETYAYGINSAGQIVGSYTFDQQTFHGFVTNPITSQVFDISASR